MQELLIPPELDSSGFIGPIDRLVLRLGWSWYHPLLYGCMIVLVALAGNYLISKERCRTLVYFISQFILVVLSMHWFSGAAVKTYAQWKDIAFGPPVILVGVQGCLVIIAWIILHWRVSWPWGSPAIPLDLR